MNEYENAERIIDGFFGASWEDALGMRWQQAMLEVNAWQQSEWNEPTIDCQIFKVAFDRYLTMIKEWSNA